MNTIESHWRQEESRWEDGLFFGNDEYIPLTGSAEKGYELGERVSISPLTKSEPDGWTSLEAWKDCEAQTDSVLIHGGETGHEGGGFIAVEDKFTRRLLWLMHLSDSEPFVKITTDGTDIFALSEEYPRQFEWQIPIATPEFLIVKTKGN